MKSKFRFNFVYFGIFLVALLLSTLASLTLYFQLTPWRLELMESKSTDYSSPYFFRDLNNDGFSELYKVCNYPNGEAHYITIYSHQAAIIDQLNIREKIDAGWVYFGDYTGDGYDECFVFSVKADSLFLYAFDIVKKESLLSRHFLMTIPDPHPYFMITDAALYDLHNNYSKELLFLVHAGLGPEPRGLYVFDLKKKQIINRFENHSSKVKLLISDLTGDSRDEVIVIGKANGNGKKEVPFTDWKNWVFFMDQNLDTIFPPLPFGGYPSTLQVLPVQMKNERYLLIAHYRAAQKHQNKPLGLYLVNSRGRFARQRYFEIENMEGIDLTVDNAENLQHIFISAGSNQLLRFDVDFNLIKQKTTPYNYPRINALQDIDLDGKAELITISTNGAQIFDQDFNLLAETETTGCISFRLRGGNLPVEIGVSGNEGFYHYKVVKNPLFNWLPALFFGMLIIFVLLLLLSNKLLTQLYTYFSYFIYSLKQTQNAVILLRPNGRISYFNSRVQSLLTPGEPLVKNRHYQQAFSGCSYITDCITKSLQNKEPLQKDFSISTGSKDIRGQLSVIPFKTSFNYIYAYLVEIQDYTAPVLSDRHKIWSRTVRKMAHDIKTPLASVLLNIERIQQKIQDSAPAAIENTENDFNMTLSEIKRIQDMTKHFLKFTNLETPNIQPVFLHEILQNTMNHFSAYLGAGLEIELNLERETHIIPADPKQLEMAFQIFIENAIDALKEKGKISISSVLAQNLEQNFKNELEIEIADNGPGIPDSLQDQIFEPFCTTKKDGTGMGLAIAKKIIHDHGGGVELISRENYGAVFRIILPAKKENT
ncbi:MAG: hypothetical protein K8R79_08080 [Calditrichales bacterium]|nr:hypothetical protein [Calditrichales bacterium]